MEPITLHFDVDATDFSRAGEASGEVKRLLKKLGFKPDVIRRVAIAMYEAEINMVIHANGGEIHASILPNEISVEFCDVGPGIPDIDLAMKEGYSTATDTVRDLGFGAGMGLPNIKKYTDEMEIHTQLGVGTTVRMKILTA